MKVERKLELKGILGNWGRSSADPAPGWTLIRWECMVQHAAHCPRKGYENLQDPI